MKNLILLLTLIFAASFTFLNPKGKVIYSSPDLNKTMVYIPNHSFNYREADTVIIDEAFVLTSVVTIKSFYMFQYEVSNGQYREFLYNLKISGDTANYRKALPDTLVWRHKLAYCEPYVEYYFRHPAYQNYPVVGVSHSQCELFCEWLTEKYNKNEKRKFKKVKFRLPTKQEWYAAANFQQPAKAKEADIKSVLDYYKLFPWEGYKLQNKEGKYMANFMAIDEASVIRVRTTDTAEKFYAGYSRENLQYIGMAGNLNDYADVTAPVSSYWPTGEGFYNMAGNVEEFVAEYGMTKGGSWHDPGYYLRNEVIETYDSTNEATSSRGFRFVMDVIEE